MTIRCPPATTRRLHWRSWRDSPGVMVSSSNFVPEGLVYGLGDSVIFVGPLTFWSLAHEGRWPMLSRYSRGMIELQRDRRQREKEKR